jgi:uncharacterized protein
VLNLPVGGTDLMESQRLTRLRHGDERAMRTLTVGTMVLVMTALGAAPAAAQQADPQTLAAPGIGRVSLVPDQAEIFLGVDRVRPTSRRARAVVNRRIAAARRAMLRAGVEPQAIRTTGISVTRDRVRARRGRPARTRFHASAQLSVLSRDIPGLGRLIDAAADAGADVFGPEWGFSDPSVGEVMATRNALADARRRADDAAAQIGMRVTGVQSVDLAPGLGDDGGFGGSDDSGGGASEGSDERTRVLPGEEEFVAVVKVVFTSAPAT